MIPRLYAPGVTIGSASVDLPEDEAHHVVHVLRLRPGARLRVFDGRGGEWEGRLLDVVGRRTTVAIDRPVQPNPEPPVAVVLALAVLKSRYMDDAVRDAVMMGASAVQPLIAARSAVRPSADLETAQAARWQRIALASVKQCGRAVVPPILSPQPHAEWLRSQQDALAVRLVLAEPVLEHPAGSDRLLDLRRVRDRGVVLLVGPEGGWEPAEYEAALDAGFQPWTISRRTLRADAIPIAALSVLLYELEREAQRASAPLSPRE